MSDLPPVRKQIADFGEWLKANPKPDLQALVAKYGTYSAIPEEAWADYHAEMARWEERRKYRHQGF